ncbi:hypothetical protein A5739_24725 [Mycobacterium colombiense]|uniref:Uncharacterized protein n=2 Tax=Mycobacteriaceae TaxID=1762 RepID=A0A0M2KA14_9MYCO|nr:hypothetical protein WN67_00870 [Mycolicibacterium obuense]OMC24254.1 hypothetical protein A5739_24725 [Mycobacterium colombiense]
MTAAHCAHLAQDPAAAHGPAQAQGLGKEPARALQSRARRQAEVRPLPGEVAALRRQALPAPEALPEMVEAQAVVQGPRLRPPKPTGRLPTEELRTSEPQQQEQLPREPPTSDPPQRLLPALLPMPKKLVKLLVPQQQELAQEPRPTTVKRVVCQRG